MKRKAAIVCDNLERVDYVYGRGRRDRLASLVELRPEVIRGAQLAAHPEAFADLEAIFSTWGMPLISPATLERLPAMRAVFYAAGSVRKFAEPLLARGILVVSAWSANAIPVAEFCLAQILLSCKGYWRNTRACRTPEGRRSKPFVGSGVFGETIGLIGCGQVARQLIQRLKPFHLRIAVYDPYLSEAEAANLGVVKSTLEQVFSESYVVSNHLPNLPELQGMLDGRLFRLMREDATFINTGRGAQVAEADLMRELEERPSLTALLDVTAPEPPEPASRLYTLPNVQLTSHIAGSVNDEVSRMADLVMDEYESWAAGLPLKHGVTPELLARMA